MLISTLEITGFRKKKGSRPSLYHQRQLKAWKYISFQNIRDYAALASTNGQGRIHYYEAFAHGWNETTDGKYRFLCHN